MENKYAGMSPYNYSMNNPVMMNDPSGMEGETPNGVWYWGKGSKDLQFDKDHTFSNFPTDKGTAVGSDHTIPWDNLRVSRHYKSDGTTEDTPYGGSPVTASAKSSGSALREKVEPLKPIAPRPAHSSVAVDIPTAPSKIEVPEESTLAKAGEFALGFVPFSGVIDVYKGMKSGDK